MNKKEPEEFVPKRNEKNEKPAKKRKRRTLPKQRNKSTPAETYYIIEKILGRRIQNGKTEYLVQWKDYSMDECTWEPEGHLKSDYHLTSSNVLKHAFVK